MAGLNLNSLKNLWSLPTSQQAPSDIPAPAASTQAPAIKAVDSVPVAPTKKFSLLSLKKGPASTEAKAANPEPVIVKAAPVPVLEKITIAEAPLPVVEEKPVIVAEAVPLAIQEPLKIETAESIFIPDNEPTSLSIEGNDIQVEVPPIVMKEFFPNLQSLGNIPLRENTDIISENIPTEGTVSPLIEESVAIETGATETPIVAEAPSSEYVVIENSPESTMIEALESTNEEYVEEVKTELSEQRRAGFRFLLGKKAKIIAGVGIIASLSVIALLSNPFLSDSVKNGKSNIQETAPIVPVDEAPVSVIDPVINETPVAEVLPVSEPVTTAVTEPVTTPVIEPATPVVTESLPTAQSPTGSGEAITEPVLAPSYEAGRDYTVTKNNKKNTKNTPIPPME